MHKREAQRGFSAIVGLVVVVVIAVVALVGYMVMHNNKPDSGAGTTGKTGASNKTEARKTDPTKFVLAPHTLDLIAWKVHMTTPADSVGKAMYKYDPDIPFYVLSTTGIVNDAECVDFYNNSISPAGLKLQQYSERAYANGVLPDVTDTTATLADYYNANKAGDGNYFIEDNNGGDTGNIERRWYKVGGYFYTLEMPVLTDSYTSGFTDNCTHESLTYYTLFAQMLTTIQAD